MHKEDQNKQKIVRNAKVEGVNISKIKKNKKKHQKEIDKRTTHNILGIRKRNLVETSEMQSI